MPTITHGGLAKTHDVSGTDFYWNNRRFDNFNIVLDVQHSTRLRILFNADVILRDHMTRMSDYSVFCALRGPVSSTSSFSSDPFELSGASMVAGCATGANILPNLKVHLETGEANDRHKFGHANFSTVHPLTTTGYYRVEIWGRSRSSSNENGDGNCELVYEGAALNQLCVELD